jgi:hypothetical protein
MHALAGAFANRHYLLIELIELPQLSTACARAGWSLAARIRPTRQGRLPAPDLAAGAAMRIVRRPGLGLLPGSRRAGPLATRPRGLSILCAEQHPGLQAIDTSAPSTHRDEEVDHPPDGVGAFGVSQNCMRPAEPCDPWYIPWISLVLIPFFSTAVGPRPLCALVTPANCGGCLSSWVNMETRLHGTRHCASVVLGIARGPHTASMLCCR